MPKLTNQWSKNLLDFKAFKKDRYIQIDDNLEDKKKVLKNIVKYIVISSKATL